MVSVNINELSVELAKAVGTLIGSGFPVKEVMEGGDNYDPCVCLENGKDVIICFDGTYAITEMNGEDVKWLLETKDFDRILEKLAGF